MTSRRKQARNSKAFHQFQLRSEGDALKRGIKRRQRRLARKQIRTDDLCLATALSGVSVDEPTRSSSSDVATDAAQSNSSSSPSKTVTATGSSVLSSMLTDSNSSAPRKCVPVIGAPITIDSDIAMAVAASANASRERDGKSRVRKPRKKVRERRAKMLRRMSKSKRAASAMSDVCVGSDSESRGTSGSTGRKGGRSTKSVRFKLDLPMQSPPQPQLQAQPVAAMQTS